MQCPFCADEGNRVIDSRLTRDGTEIRRRRQCEECGRRFTTRERVEEITPRIIKRDERREEYDRNKLLRGVEHACVKRPVSAEAIGRLIDRVERELQESGEREVTSDHVGRRALEELSAIDVLAAVRFASVFLDFSRPSDYEAFFSQLSTEGHDSPGPEEGSDDRTVRSLGVRR
ncbi:MAG TPA: transcriptional repressor NrdR [Deltaproteobacteria bacterium]|nr:transcriptional repressor NrdR [Deltaproteobacteria bacterium]